MPLDARTRTHSRSIPLAVRLRLGARQLRRRSGVIVALPNPASALSMRNEEPDYAEMGMIQNFRPTARIVEIDGQVLCQPAEPDERAGL